ncbi:MAG: hypothetical protein M1837_005360 [Sclerophora amabilis]|nr:MAG: hypothetical protein M1837_005360 [Sclerophora amabilis]
MTLGSTSTSTSTSNTPRILLLGGHGKVALLLTPHLLARSWNVTSVIRDEAQREDILNAAAKAQAIARSGGPDTAAAAGAGTDDTAGAGGNGSGSGSGSGVGKLDILISSLDEVKSEGDARKVIEQVGAHWVVWCAGAGGKGGPERTYAIDRDAARHYISASVPPAAAETGRSTSSSSSSGSGSGGGGVRKFLMISALSNRRGRAAWWTDEDWALVQRMNTEFLPHYYAAKMDADEYLTGMAEAARRGRGRSNFQAIVLRPGGLSDEPATGFVSLGKTKAKGMVTRGDVAHVAARLLERDDTHGWYDLLSGQEDVAAAVSRVATEQVDAIEGEDVQRIYDQVYA